MNILNFFKKRNKTYEEACAELKEGDVFIDLGANTGQQLVTLIHTKAEIYGFEPDTLAYEFLKAQVEPHNNVKLYHAAIWDKDSTTKLYKHNEKDKLDKYVASYSSSIIKEKINVSEDDYEEVETIDIGRFLQELNKDVKIIKMDIEGAEYDVVNRILDLGLQDRIKYVYVETHANRLPGYEEKDIALRERLKAMNIKNIDLNWH